ncbi:MAG: NAD-dependent epimerase/dehydratase family protein [Gammaproteobacteria bacterium]|nr:NAD-dependent epimerase/dehydratase family protein [Gammaproteobacteria bacterium]
MPGYVALTGATGFIGKTILADLLQHGFRVKALSRKQQQDTENLHWIVGDLHSLPQLNALVENVDTVIHCAGAVRGSSLKEFVSINNTGSINLLNACQSKNTRIRLLHISSLAAREPQLSWYAKSKRLAEAELITRKNNVLTTIFRPTAIYGPGDKEIKPLLKSLKAGFLPAPDTQSQFSLLHIDDLVVAIRMWLEQKSFPGGIYELDDGSLNGYNWETLIQLTNQVWGKSVVRIPIPVPLLEVFAKINLKMSRLLGYSPMLTPGKVREITHLNWVCDNHPLTNTLGWSPTITLADAMNTPDLLQL